MNSILEARDDPSVLVIAESRSDREQLSALARGAGGRLLDVVSAAEAPDRLDRIVDVNLVLFSCRSAGPEQIALLVRLDTLALMNDIGLVVEVAESCLDEIFPYIRSSAVQLLCAPQDADRAAAIAVGLRSRPIEPQLHDISRESDASRLQKLSEEVSRIVQAIESLTRDMAERGQPLPSPYDRGTPSPAGPANPGGVADRPGAYFGEMPSGSAFSRAARRDVEPSATQIRDMLRARRLRDQFLPPDLFADPAWDMLLDLMAARLSGERVSVSSLCIAAAVPPTTALRWIRQLTDRGIFVRQADPDDGRRVFIALSDDAAAAISRWFGLIRRILVSDPGTDREGPMGA